MNAPYINITIPNRENEKILKAINLLLRVAEDNMQAISDFVAAQQAFHHRMDAVIPRIEARLAESGFSDADQQGLNGLHNELQARIAKLEALVGPPVV